MIQVTGHRGAAGLEPENTLRSIKKALDLGVDRIELDVHLTKDNHLVVIHDATVDRTTNSKGQVKDFTFEQIRQLDAGKGERIPTLQEVIEQVKGKCVLQIELKAPNTAKPVVECVKSLGARHTVPLHLFVITSFQHDFLKEVKAIDPNIRIGALFSQPPSDACDRAKELSAEAVHINFRHINKEIVEKAHQLGLEVRVWNPDTEAEMKPMLELDVDGIGTNRPDILLMILGRG